MNYAVVKILADFHSFRVVVCRERSSLMQAKVQSRGLLLRFDTCEHVHTINPCAGQRLSLLQKSEDLRGRYSVSVYTLAVGLEWCCWVGSRAHE